MRAYYLRSDITCWSRVHIKSYNKLKTLWILFSVTCDYQIWQKSGLWLRVTCLTAKSHMPVTIRLLKVTWQINFIMYFFEFCSSEKKSFGEDTLFLKLFHFCINFINFLRNICVDEVALKIQVLNQNKDSWSGI